MTPADTMFDMSDADPERENRRRRIHSAFERDILSGGMKPLEQYLEIFAEDRELVQEEYALIQRKTLTGTGGRGTDSDESDIGPYRVVEELGRGGQGVVYLAEDRELSRRVALKVLRHVEVTDSDSSFLRFRREVQATSRLDHPGICSVFSAGVHEGLPYIAMRYVEGETISARIAASKGADDTLRIRGAKGQELDKQSAGSSSHRTEIENVVSLLEMAARALHVAHEAGVVHRDIKPSNIMVTPSGQPVVLDFGLATELDESSPSITRSGDLFGTLAYMSPEQLLAHRVQLDRRTDVYSLGVTLYEWLTLQRPFDAPTREGLYQAIQTKEPQDPRRLNSAISSDLRIVLSTAMEKDRDRRYQSALDFAEDLRRVREKQPIQARPVGPLLRLRRWAQRNPAVAAAVAVAFLCLAVGLTTTLIQKARADRHLEDYAQLWDLDRLQDLEQEAPKLWPAASPDVDAIEAWLVEARRLLAARPQHERALGALRARALPLSPTQIEQSQAPLKAELLEYETQERETHVAYAKKSKDEQARLKSFYDTTITTLRERQKLLSKRIEERSKWPFDDARDRFTHSQLAELKRGLDRMADPANSYGVPRMESTLDAVKALLAERASADRKTRWAVAIDAIEDSRRYRDLEVAPQAGLLPVGRDPDSKLLEFCIEATGRIPERDDNKRLRMSGDSAIVLVLLPGGTAKVVFDRQLQEVALEPFFMSKYEVTQGQWHRLTGQNPSALDRSPGASAHPVESVSWSTVVDVGTKLGLQLPTVAQWTYASMAGSAATWGAGRDLSDFATVERPLGHTAVGSLSPNPFGLHDVLGNVAEWCRDSEDAWNPDRLRSFRPGDGFRKFLNPRLRIYKGGSYASTKDQVAFYATERAHPASIMMNVGVRYVRPLHP